MYLGPFYFDTKELFLIVSAAFLLILIILEIPLIWFEASELLTLLIIILITKGLLPAIHNEAYFTLSFVTIFATIFSNLFWVVLFYFIAFILFRLFRII